MRIRSITSFYDPTLPTAQRDLETLAIVSGRFRASINAIPLEVQSTRLSTSPFPYYLNKKTTAEMIDRVCEMEESSRNMDWSYLSLGPALPSFDWSYEVVPKLLKATENVFFGGIIADRDFLYPKAVRECARVIQVAASITPDGFSNLRFAALANVPPFTPFLPAAWHQAGSPPAISVAVECADMVQEAFTGSQDLEASGNNLLAELESAAQKIQDAFIAAAGESGIRLAGFDFSPAPFPEDWCSLGAAVEKLGLSHIGGLGSLAAVAFIADTLDRGKWPRAGFNGMMLPVLEDSVLAKQAADSQLTIQDLLLYSTVCGTGLDTVPLPGNATLEDLESVLMDIGAVAVRLGKPLTARLMPIPGKSAGDSTSFTFSFFAPSRVMSLHGQALHAPLNGDQPIHYSPRKISSS